MGMGERSCRRRAGLWRWWHPPWSRLTEWRAALWERRYAPRSPRSPLAPQVAPWNDAPTPTIKPATAVGNHESSAS